MAFAAPDWLWALLLVPVSTWLLHLRASSRRRRLRQVLGQRLEQSLHQSNQGRRRLSRWCFSLALAFTLLAAAQPLWGESEEQLEHQPKNWVICLDVSRSMLAQDHAAQGNTTRLQAARSLVEEICSQVGGDRMALIPFAGKARLMVPLTEDLAALTEMLDLSSDRRLVGGGSDLGAALALAFQTIEAAPENLPTAVLVLSDGEDWGQQTQAQVEKLADQNLALTCVGFGSPLGSKIPFDGAFLQDSDGNDVVTALKEDSLRRIANQSEGIYLTVSTLSLDRVALRQPKFESGEASNTITEVDPNLAQRFQWPLALACLLWLMELLAARRRKT